MLKIGDKVKIVKNYDSKNKEHYSVAWIDEGMDKYIGKTVIIRSIGTWSARLVGIGYNWHFDWLKPIDKKPLTLKNILAARND